MHVGNIKQGQGRQFGWRPFFKCGKQKNKIILAVAAVGRAASVGEWPPESLLPVSCVHQNHGSLPNTKTLHSRYPQMLESLNRKKEEKNPHFAPKGSFGEQRDEAVGDVGSGWGLGACVWLQILKPPWLCVLLEPAGMNGVTVCTAKATRIGGESVVVFKNKYLRFCGQVPPMPTKPEERKQHCQSSSCLFHKTSNTTLDRFVCLMNWLVTLASLESQEENSETQSEDPYHSQMKIKGKTLNNDVTGQRD